MPFFNRSMFLFRRRRSALETFFGGAWDWIADKDAREIGPEPR